jgi:hypothetical protein
MMIQSFVLAFQYRQKSALGEYRLAVAKACQYKKGTTI